MSPDRDMPETYVSAFSFVLSLDSLMSERKVQCSHALKRKIMITSVIGTCLNLEFDPSSG